MADPRPPFPDRGPIAVTGLPAENPSQPPMRKEISEMRKDPDEWNLYLLGLERFQMQDERDPLSYYKIAGIHGVPYETWPDEGWNKGNMAPQAKEGKIGFCPHTSIIFIPWHRPYLALFEAELWKHVNEIASLYTDPAEKEKYTKIARNFRIPYWDWALPSKGLIANEVLESGFKVNRPKHKSQEGLPDKINPLYSYKFGTEGQKVTPLMEMVADPKASVQVGGKLNVKIEGNLVVKVQSTVRYPTISGVSDDVATRQRFKDLWDDKLDYDKEKDPERDRTWKKGKNLTERTLYVLQSYEKFNAASYNKYSGIHQANNWGSLEDLHNQVHNYVGGNGHMSDTQTSAFDPIFWLHHANIDRLCAIWQALHDDPKKDDTYVVEAKTYQNSWLTKWGGMENKDTKLWPFNKTAKNDQNYWTSADARYTSTFGYVYPETRNWVYKTPEELNRHLMELYRNGSLAHTAKLDEVKIEGFDQATKELENRAKSILAVDEDPDAPNSFMSFGDIALPEGRKVTDLVHDGKYYEWLVNIRAEKHARSGNMVVHVFLGRPDDEHPELYITNPSHVASFSTLGQSPNTGCDRCRRDQENRTEVTGQIPLTMALVERYLAGQLKGLAPQEDQAIGYLRENLHWRVTDAAGIEIPRRELGDDNQLLIVVASNEVTLPSDPYALPTYAPKVVTHPEVTTRGDVARGDGTGYEGGRFSAFQLQ